MIKARIQAANPNANLKSYTETYKRFNWDEVAKEFTWCQSGKVNIIHEAIDRWAEDSKKQNQKAIIFEKGAELINYTYRDLRKKSCQWANFLSEYGYKTGDRLFIFAPSCPEAYLAMLGACRLGVIFCHLFSSTSFNELALRLANAKPRGILTHPDLVERIPPEAKESVRHIFLTEGPSPGLFPDEIVIEGLPEQMPKTCDPIWLDPKARLYMNYTSGSTGPPKGIVHAHNDMLGILISARYVLDLKDDTMLWVDADPAWVTGTVYGVFGPLLCGATSLVQGDEFSASNWYWTLEKHGVSVCYTTPKTLMKLKAAGDNLPTRYDLSRLRHLATVGAPLVPDLFYWVRQNLNLSPHDTYWMTETGMISLSNYPSMDIKPGSMGKPFPGIEAAVLDEKGQPLPPLSMGELAFKIGWPAMMSDLWQDSERYQSYFRVKGWFLTGDIVIKDDQGYYYHQGRNDDLMKIGGDRVIGPFEIEQVLCGHPAVDEAAVISKGTEPGEGVSYLKAFITVNQNYTPSVRLNHEIKAFVKANMASDVIVKEVTFLNELPKTRSGKLLRRVLRAKELGLPGGDALKMQE
ncbi:MAG: AMP-binding protein [Desulfobacterales bacterium]|nr:MAG: AMP-binding protein [Desulfobacterales bacterium]